MSTIATAANGNYSATASWTGGVLPGPTDVAKFDHIINLDLNANVGGIDPTGAGCLVGSNPVLRLVVGNAGRPQFVAKAVIL